MAKRGREAMAKRAREMRRQQQKEDKKERREAIAEKAAASPPVDETALLEEFALLGKKYEANLVDEASYLEERHRIFVALGIETEEEE